MKLRTESQGYHFYDRKTGLHFLFDELKPLGELTFSPRTVSIALTNNCNANCSFCHITKGELYLDKNFVINICKALDKIGTFDIALGGGEPLLHPELVEICKTVWRETKLGISITTNGQLLTSEFIDELKNNISFLRVSIDSVNEACYNKIRNFSLSSIKDNISLLSGKIPFGLNMVITNETIKELDDILRFAMTTGAEELLLLPVIKDGKFDLTSNEWEILENWITKNHEKFPIRILEQARKKIKIPILFMDDDYYMDYLYLSPDKQIKVSSYEKKGEILNEKKIEKQITSWTKKRLTRKSPAVTSFITTISP